MPFNLGSGSTHRVADAITQICQLMDTDITPKIVEKASTFKEIEQQYLDLTRLRTYVREFDYTPMSEGLKKTIEWYTKYQNRAA